MLIPHCRVSDPSTGELLTEGGPASYETGEEWPKHDLDDFHGALNVCPDGPRIADDGWIWQPNGVVSTWSIDE